MRIAQRNTGPPLRRLGIILAGWAYALLLIPATAPLGPPSPQITSPTAVAFVPKTAPLSGSPVQAQASYAEPLGFSALASSDDTTDLCEVSCRRDCRPLVAILAPGAGSSLVRNV